MRTSPGRSWLLLLGLCSLLGSLFPLPTRAAGTLTVNSLADPGTGGCDVTECTLREALAAAQDGDTLTFAPALFTPRPRTLTLTAGVLDIVHDVTIVGPGRRLLKISGNQASRVFRIPAGVVASIERVTIKRGHDTVGGGGLLNAGTLTLNQSTVRDNTAGHTGGGLANAGTLTLNESTVRDNTARYGGGLLNRGTLTLRLSAVRGNSADSGGGLYNSRGTLTLDRSTVRDNIAGSDSGGLFNAPMSTLTLDRSTVRGNTARYAGGGLRNSGLLTLRLSTVSGNSADRGGGLLNAGITNDSDGVLLNATLTLSQSTVSSNSADSAGGGLYNSRATLTLRTTIVAGNTASTGPDCSQQPEGTLRPRGHNLTGTATGCPSETAQGDVTVDPATVFSTVLGPLQDNGGPTFTHALLPGSPALDAGDPDHCHGTDQRGVPRPQGDGCDIGAFEREE